MKKFNKISDNDHCNRVNGHRTLHFLKKVTAYFQLCEVFLYSVRTVFVQYYSFFLPPVIPYMARKSDAPIPSFFELSVADFLKEEFKSFRPDAAAVIKMAKEYQALFVKSM